MLLGDARVEHGDGPSGSRGAQRPRRGRAHQRHARHQRWLAWCVKGDTDHVRVGVEVSQDPLVHFDRDNRKRRQALDVTVPGGADQEAVLRPRDAAGDRLRARKIGRIVRLGPELDDDRYPLALGDTRTQAWADLVGPTALRHGVCKDDPQQCRQQKDGDGACSHGSLEVP